MDQELKCPKCQDAMVQGFIPYSGSANTKYLISWVEGPPKKSFWTYTKVPLGGEIAVAAFRCQGCGYLEFYANEKFAAE